MSYRGSTGSLGGAMSNTGALSKAPTALEQLLEEINFQRTKEMRQLLKEESGFVVFQGTTYWTDLFVRHFLFQTDHCIDCDDLLFFVRKKHVKGSSRHLPKFDTEVDVFRKASRKLPIGDPDMDWEETVYLNLIIHQFEYTLTLAICTRTSPKELQVIKRHSQKVYASPSRRRMDTKAEVEEMTYPNVCFMVDNFNEVFSDILVRDGEMVCVELVASDKDGAIQGVIFLGSIRYDALKRVYDARSSLSSKMAQRMTFGLFSNSTSQRVEFVRMKGPQGKGHAEMAVTKPKGYSGAETPTSEPGYCATDMWDSDWDSDSEDFFVYKHQRRLSDPSANINNFVRGGWKTKPAESAGSKARSENEGLDCLANGLNEIEAGDLRDDCEFCPHSDVSTPSEVSPLVPSGQPSIISSFFPNCNTLKASSCHSLAKVESELACFKDSNDPNLSQEVIDVNPPNIKLDDSVNFSEKVFKRSTDVSSDTTGKNCVLGIAENTLSLERKESTDLFCDKVESVANSSEDEDEFEDCSSGDDIESVTENSPDTYEETNEVWTDALDVESLTISEDATDFSDCDKVITKKDCKDRLEKTGELDAQFECPSQVYSKDCPDNLRQDADGSFCRHKINIKRLCLLCQRNKSSSSEMTENFHEDCRKFSLHSSDFQSDCQLQSCKIETPTSSLPCLLEESPDVVPTSVSRGSFKHKRQSSTRRSRGIDNSRPPCKTVSDGTVIYYWCDVPGGYVPKVQNELDDGAYNPLWTMRGFTQTFHFWKENKRAQSVPLNAFLTYVTLPWWSIVKDLLDQRESPILTF